MVKLINAVAGVVYTKKIDRKSFLVSGEFPIVSQERGLINGYWDDEEDLFKIKVPVSVFGDHTKVLKYIDFDFVLGADGVKILEPKTFLNPKYFFYFLQSLKLKDLGYARHFRLLKDVEVIYPASLVEQKHIVKILDAAFEKIEIAKQNTEKNLQNAKELFESHLQGLFKNTDGPGSVGLDEVCKIVSKLVDPRKLEFQEMIHVGGANMLSKTGGLVNLHTAKQEGLISGKFLFDSQTVLYSKIRPYLMKVARPDFRGLCSADVYPLSPVPRRIDRDYLYYLLLTPRFTNYAILGSGRAGMPKVNREHLFSFRFCLPPLVEQKFVVAKLDALSEKTKKLEAIYEKKLANLEELKKALLKKAFAGEL